MFQQKNLQKNLLVFTSHNCNISAEMKLSLSFSACLLKLAPAWTLVSMLLALGGKGDAASLIQITPDNPSTTASGFVVLSSGWHVLNPFYSSETGLADYGVANLPDSNGDLTGISLAADDTNKFNAYNSDGSTLSSPNLPADVRRESFFGNDVALNGFIRPTATWVFSGFDPNDDLTFTFYASRMGVSDNREGLYQVVGATTQSTTLNASNNDSNTASVTLKADASGNVVLNMSKGANNNNANGFYYLNAMTIEIVPEPSSAMLVLVAGLGLCVMRRRG